MKHQTDREKKLVENATVIFKHKSDECEKLKKEVEELTKLLRQEARLTDDVICNELKAENERLRDGFESIQVALREQGFDSTADVVEGMLNRKINKQH